MDGRRTANTTIPPRFLHDQPKLFHPHEAGMSDAITHVTDESFEPEVLKSDVPVLVDYWAEWCGPCKAIAPVLDELAKEYGGKLKIVKLNVDENGETAKKYNVRGIPTLMLF